MTQSTKPSPPVAPRRPHSFTTHGITVTDDYAWIKDPKWQEVLRDPLILDPDIRTYLEAENENCEAWFAPHAELVETLFNEIKSRIQETDESVPTLKDGWWYATRTEEGLQYPIHCRGASRETATATTILDENALADGHEYFSLGSFDISPDTHLLIWSSDTDGSEHFNAYS